MAAPPSPTADVASVVRAVLGVREALAATPLAAALEPTPERDLVTLYETQSVDDALQTLAAWNLLSAPVLKGPPPWRKPAAEEGGPSAFAPAESRAPRMRDLLGFISVNTIMRAFVAGAPPPPRFLGAHKGLPTPTPHAPPLRPQRRPTSTPSAAARSPPRRASCGTRSLAKPSVRVSAPRIARVVGLLTWLSAQTRRRWRWTGR